MAIKVEILDLKGAIVYSSIEPKNELNLPQNIQTGYYTVVIQTAEGVVRKELMIQKQKNYFGVKIEKINF